MGRRKANVTKISEAIIQGKIYLIRGTKVMRDSDLAALYEVETKYLTRQVRRNVERFPNDFMFRLTLEEYLRCQNVTSKDRRGGRRYLPYAFTEQGVAMLSSVLHSYRAIQVNIEIMRAFAKVRGMLQAHKNLWKKVEEMEAKYNHHFKLVFAALRKLLQPPRKPERRIGFHP